MKGGWSRGAGNPGNYAKGFYLELAGSESPLKWGSGVTSILVMFLIPEVKHPIREHLQKSCYKKNRRALTHNSLCRENYCECSVNFCLVVLI